jgi:hypothetical protein
MAGTYWLNAGGGSYPDGSTANNGFIRYNLSADHYRVNIGVSQPSNSSVTAFGVQGNGNFLSWIGGDVNFTSSGFYGNNPGNGPSVDAFNSSGTIIQTWTGGVGGYISWRYNAPSAPTTISATRSSDGKTLSVTASGGTGRITYYKVSIDNANWYDNGYTFTNLTSTAKYTIYTYCGNEDANSSSAALGPSYGQLPAVSTFTTATSSTTAGAINLSWLAPSSIPTGQTVSGYTILRTVSGATTTTTITTTNTSYTDTGLIPGTKYDYKIYATSNTNYSASNGLTSSKLATYAASTPSAPSSISVILSGTNATISISKDANGYENNVTGYKVQKSSDNTNWNTANDMDSNGTYTYTGLTGGQTYYFRVFAINIIGAGTLFKVSDKILITALGKRYGDAGWLPISTIKRYDGTTWQPITTFKRYDGTSWVGFQ